MSGSSFTKFVNQSNGVTKAVRYIEVEDHDTAMEAQRQTFNSQIKQLKIRLEDEIIANETHKDMLSLEQYFRRLSDSKLKLAIARLKDIIEIERHFEQTGQKSALQGDCESTLEEIEKLNLPKSGEKCPECGNEAKGSVFCSADCFFKNAAKETPDEEG